MGEDRGSSSFKRKKNTWRGQRSAEVRGSYSRRLDKQTSLEITAARPVTLYMPIDMRDVRIYKTVDVTIKDRNNSSFSFFQMVQIRRTA